MNQKNHMIELCSYKSASKTRTFKSGVFITLLMMGFLLSTACASDPIAIVNNLSDFIFDIIKAIGIIMLLLGLVQLGLSLKSHDASQRATSFLTITGGLVVAFSKEILTLIGAL